MRNLSPDKILVILEGRVQYERNVLRGIREFASSREDWLIRLEYPGRKTAQLISDWQPDGLLFQSVALTPDLIQQLAHHPRAIHLSESSSLRSVGLDNQEIGKQAAKYLAGRGFKSFAFAGYEKTGFSQKRGQAFRESMKSHPFPCQCIDLSERPSERDVTSWLNGLPKPCGLFATHDECALFLLTLCHSANLRCPEDIAILGVDNDTLMCEIAWPQLSSVSVPSRRVGWEASRLLSQILHNEVAEPASIFLPPTGIITRQTTDIHQTGSETVNRSLRYMESHYKTRINIDDVLRETGVSRRRLELKFRQFTGNSPLRELQRMRIAEAERLLADTDLPLHQIAPRCGCRDATQLGSLFKKVKGITPGNYRNQHSYNRKRPE
ncbi:MAG: DNA-binding transcriptional regulator [Verrucomicrobiales bacterium]|nr:DNA-binding transcriptional regulator [Verrucomicrobiales bacterium]